MIKSKQLMLHYFLLGIVMISSLWTFSLQNEASLSKQEHIRGVWLTNVASEALLSKQNIIETVETCSKLGFNTIYVVTWNRGHTLYPSDIMEKLTGNKIHPVIPDGFDPLDILIKEAKKKDIKVHAWFEFGFAASHRDTTGGILIEKMPHWASRDRIGKITTKNDFQWMNPFHPEVQDFISSLILEVVQKYDVAGIQGDDRLPALPSNGGYDDYTVELYKSEHSGKAPPEYEKDYEWVKWRSSKLTDFLIELVDTLRSVDPNLEISMAPSIYPWAEENYLQDWPSWVNAGLVDKVIPQIYRYDFDAYKKEFNQILLRQISQDQHHIFAPGVLLQVDDYVASEKILKEKINLHREHGIDSEVYFFYEGIKKREEFFKKIYKR